MIDSEVRNMNPLHYIQNHFQKWKESIYCHKHIAMTKAILSSGLFFKNCCMLTDSPDRQSLLFTAAIPFSLCSCSRFFPGSVGCSFLFLVLYFSFLFFLAISYMIFPTLMILIFRQIFSTIRERATFCWSCNFRWGHGRQILLVSFFYEKH